MVSSRTAQVYVHDRKAAVFIEDSDGYMLKYHEDYDGPPISLTLPVRREPYRFTEFPAFFDGLLPEGPQLEALLRLAKLDRHDYFGQLLQVGKDCIGAVSVEEWQA